MNTIKKAAILSIVTALFTLALKFGAYFITNSIGLFSDAIESFINVGSGLMLFAVLAIVAIPEDENHNYGHYKAEYFAAGVEGSLIIIAAITIIYAATMRLFHPTPITQIIPGIIIAVIATLANLFTAKLMLKISKSYDSVALEANAQHIITDVWTTVCVFIGLIVIYYAPPRWQIVDPIIAILVALHIISTGVDLLKRAIDGLMDVTLPTEDLVIIKQAIADGLATAATNTATDEIIITPPVVVSGITATTQATQSTNDNCVKNLRSRKSGSKRFIEFKLLLAGELTVSDSHKICDYIETEICKHFNDISINIHVEPR